MAFIRDRNRTAVECRSLEEVLQAVSVAQTEHPVRRPETSDASKMKDEELLMTTLRYATKCRLVSSPLWLVSFILAAAMPASPAELRVWEASINAHTKERFIPVELWTGADWDGQKILKTVPVDGTYRHRTSTYYIKGPTDWRHPKTGETFVVYERLNPGRTKDDDKLQLFTINEDKTGLSRLFDGRPGRDTRTYSGGLKFPLGLWTEGEPKSFVYNVWDANETARAETITIKQINFAYQGTPYCLEIYWTATDRSGRKAYDRQTYIYCPGKSMVSQIQQ